MKLAKALDEKIMDIRLRDKLMAEGKLTKAQVDEYLNKVTDDRPKATEVKVEDIGRGHRQ